MALTAPMVTDALSGAAGDGGALDGAMTDISGAAATPSLLVDAPLREDLRQQQARTMDVSRADGGLGSTPVRGACRDLRLQIEGRWAISPVAERGRTTWTALAPVESPRRRVQAGALPGGRG